MSKKARSVTIVCIGLLSAAATAAVIGLLFSAAAAKASAEESARLEEAKSNIISLINSGDHAQAQEQAEKLLEDFPENPALPEVLYEIAEGFRWSHVTDRDKEKYEHAQKIYQQIIENYPDSSLASKAALGIARAKVLYFIVAEDFNSAGQALNEMTANFASDPNLPDELYWIGRGYGYWERHEDEKKAYQQIIQNYPDSAYADKARIGFAKANIQLLIQQQDFNDANEALDKLMADFSDNPDLPEALYWIAERYSWMDRYEEAMVLHQQIIEAYPDSSIVDRARLDLSKAEVLSLISHKDYNGADAVLDKMFTDFKGHPIFPRALLAIAEQCCKQGLSKQKDDPNQAKAIYGSVVKVCDRLINELPDSPLVPEACRGAAYGYFRLGRPQDSIPYFQKVVDDYPQAEFAWSAQCWLGDCYEKLRISGAMAEPNASIQIEAAYQAVVEKYPDCPSIEHAYLKLAELYLRENAPADAAYYLESYLEKSWEGDPRVEDALYDLGRAYEQMGELELAAEAYAEFLEVEPHKDVARAQAVREKLEEWEGEDK